MLPRAIESTRNITYGSECDMAEEKLTHNEPATVDLRWTRGLNAFSPMRIGYLL